MWFVSWFAWLPAIVFRAVIGVIFIQSGWGKIHHLPKVIEYFTSLGIPAAAFQARFVSFTELLCGSLILLGLATRLASIPLITTMVVAILSAKKDQVEIWSDLFGLSEFLYIVILIPLLVDGAGSLSLDRIFTKYFPQSRKK